MSEPLIRPAEADADSGGRGYNNAELAQADRSHGGRSTERSWLAATLPVAMIAVFTELGLSIINNSVMPIYLTNGLGLDTVIMTNVMMPFLLSETVFKGPLGILADRWGRKPLMVIGPAISIFTPLALVALHYPAHHVIIPLLLVFGLLRLLDGLGAAALWPAMFAYIGDHVRAEKRASAMALLNVTYMLGLAFSFSAGGWADDTFGPVLSGAASLHDALQKVYQAMGRNMRRHISNFQHIGHHPALHDSHLHLKLLHEHAVAAGLPDLVEGPAQYYPSFYFGSILFALATAVALLALKDRAADRKEGVEEHPIADAAHGEKITWQSFVATLKTVPHLMLIALITFMGIGCIMMLVKVFARDDLGVGETAFGLLVLPCAVVIGALAIPLGHVSDKFGKVRSVRCGFLVASVGMWGLVLLYGFPQWRDLGLIGGASLLGLGFVLSFPAWMALLTMTGNESNRGTIVGAVSTAQGLGAIIGVELGGWLYTHAFRDQHLSHITPFAASAILLSAATVLTFFLIHSDHPSVKEAAVSSAA